ncbi:MAG: YraN family protein [Candidatus Aureabacteria bacterium]|nr:YraN family protein [Candidatus Auribacterota bacterium]
MQIFSRLVKRPIEGASGSTHAKRCSGTRVKRAGLGRKGEQVAEKYLRRIGYKILARNYRCARGEIDLIARDGDTMVFVEIKGKSGARFGPPLEAVTARKRARIVFVANQFLTSYRLHHALVRFDVVGLLWGGDGDSECVLVKDAFRLPL